MPQLKSLQDIRDKLVPLMSDEAFSVAEKDIEEILRLKKEKNAVILAHNYMTPDIFYGVADIVGDSLALAREAAKLDADIIVVAGVHFMAETAKLLNPDRLVLIPDPSAGCSLADSITPEDVRGLRAKHPGLPIITYVNTSAAVKAECDICCTSGNAKQIVESLNVPEVIMVPDQFLAQNVARQTDVKIITWHGHCEVHEKFSPDYIKATRENNPGLSIIAHPECPPDVVEASDYSGSTVGMADWVDHHHPDKVMLLTEASMSDNVSLAHPELAFVRPPEICPHMKRITLSNIRKSLEEETVAVDVPENIAEAACKSVTRMIEVK